ncbi:MAG TPA: hypothetical protein VJS44_02675 [Pyrinomonadaceae bacterium]|nr:hypothetical protein [Pyrinomonadaceae bacterium]
MSARITVIFYIVLCLEVGIVLTLLPWIHVLPFLPSFGLGDWGDNFFLLYASQKMGLQGLRPVIASGWVRGAVSGLGVLNLFIAFWEITHFRQTVRALQAGTNVIPRTEKDGAQASTADSLPDNGRRDDAPDRAGQP